MKKGGGCGILGKNKDRSELAMIYTERFYVGYGDCGAALTISNTALLRLFENIASMHGAAVGDSPLTSPYRWVLLSYHVEVVRRPQFNRCVTVKSWNRAVKGVTSCREFEVYDEDGALVCTATSNWVRIDAESGKLQRLGAEVAAQYGSEDHGNFPSPWIAKVKEPEEAAFTVTKTVPRHFIDANRHMNNVAYLDLANDVLPTAAWEQGEYDRFTIYYRKASYLGETLHCTCTEAETGHTVTVRGAEGDVRALLLFER